ncbi:MAG: hypothetical protein WCT12_24095 [Verrucomicrobiota bacterium]|jgi:hypothetical protein
MGTCMFVASGLNFDVDAYFPGSPFKGKIATVFRKGQIPPRDNPQKIARPDSGFVHMVSATQEPHLQFQIGPALEFLSRNRKEFERLKRVGVDNMLLDFGMEEQQTIERAQYLPPELLKAMSRFHMGLIFSTVRIPSG